MARINGPQVRRLSDAAAIAVVITVAGTDPLAAQISQSSALLCLAAQARDGLGPAVFACLPGRTYGR